MTVPITQNRIDYTAPAANVALAIPFPVFDATHLVLTKDADGSVLTTGTHYTVALDVGGDYQTATATPTVAGAALIGAGKLIIRRVVPYTQPLDIPAGNRLPEKEIEKAFDLAVMRAQQLDQRADEVEAIMEAVLVATTDLAASVAAATSAAAAAAASATAASEALATIGAAITTYLQGLPETLPATPDQPWWNGDVLSKS